MTTTKPQDDRLHPRYGEYLAYRSAIQRQQVTPATFDRWLDMTVREESEDNRYADGYPD